MISLLCQRMLATANSCDLTVGTVKTMSAAERAVVQGKKGEHGQLLLHVLLCAALLVCKPPWL
jgi:hypothetical protein